MEDNHKKSSVGLWPWIIGIIAVVCIIIVALMLGMQGTTSTSGEHPDPEATESITCTNNSEVLSLLDPRNATSKSTKVIATFTDGKMGTISVSYSLGYASEADIKNSQNINHAGLNLATQNAGLGADIFNLHFSALSDSLEIRMYAEVDDITGANAKYLMLEQAAGSYTKSSVKNNYASQGFKCS